MNLLGAVKKIFANTANRAESLNSNPIFSEYNATRLHVNRKGFCHAPSVNMLFSQSGKVYACCHNQEFSIGSYPKESVSEIWNSDKAIQFRKTMKDFDLSQGCGICHADLQTKDFNEIRASQFDRIPRHKSYPTMMEFLVSNTCNLECIMCKGEFSSLIRKNREKLPPITTPYDEKFITQLKEFIPYLHETRFSGSGEAFSIEMNYRIWDMIIELNPKCVIMVQTNGTYLNARIKDYLERGNFQIGVSLDSLKKETYEEIRLNSNLEKVMEHIDYFHEYSAKRKVKFSIALCVMRQNWHELPAFINYANSLNATATFHKVWNPVEYSLSSLGSEELNRIYTYLSGFKFDTLNSLQEQNVAHYSYIVKSVKEWLKESLIREKEVENFTHQTYDQIISAVRNKVHSYLSTIIKDEELRTKKLTEFMDKYEMSIRPFEDKKRNELLKAFFTHRIEKVYSGVMKRDAKLIELEAEKYLDKL